MPTFWRGVMALVAVLRAAPAQRLAAGGRALLGRSTFTAATAFIAKRAALGHVGPRPLVVCPASPHTATTVPLAVPLEPGEQAATFAYVYDRTARSLFLKKYSGTWRTLPLMFVVQLDLQQGTEKGRAGKRSDSATVATTRSRKWHGGVRGSGRHVSAPRQRVVLRGSAWARGAQHCQTA